MIDFVVAKIVFHANDHGSGNNRADNIVLSGAVVLKPSPALLLLLSCIGMKEILLPKSTTKIFTQN